MLDLKTAQPPELESAASLYAPAVGADALVRRYIALQSEALSRIGGRIAERLPGPERHNVEAALALFGTLPAAERQGILCHPLYHYWWRGLRGSYRAGEMAPVRRWARAFPALVVPAGLRSGAFPEEGLLIEVAEDGAIRFRTESLVLPGGRPCQSARVSVSKDSVGVSGADFAFELPLQALTVRNFAGAGLEHAATVGPMAAAIDTRDPWIHAFLRDLNITETAPDQPLRELRAIDLDDRRVSALSRNLDDIAELWPEMSAEMAVNVRLFVPVVSDTMEAFTNTGFQGGIFLRADFAVEWFLLERLVHEASHLRLNLIMAIEAIHTAPPDLRLPSPFRGEPRPVNGLFHGAFVFTRSAEALARLHARTGEPAVASRVAELSDKAAASFGIIESHVPLTPFGQTLVQDIRTTLFAIAR
jgi:HEXXH motif-containing protein